VIAWPGMPDPGALKEAAARVGRPVTLEPVSSNEDLEQLMAGPEPADLVFPSDYLVERLVAADALVALEVPGVVRDRLAGWARELDCDPGCRWSIPFAFGTTGVLCDVAAGGGDSWSVLFDPALDGKVGMLDEVREVLGAALIAAGHDPNDISEGALADARSMLDRQRGRVARYDSDDFVAPVARGEVVAHHAWSGPAAMAVREHARLRYLVPREGAVLWVTTAAVPAAAAEPEVSMRLLAELTDPELAARTTAQNGFATPSGAARDLLPEALREDPALFPAPATIARCRTLHDLGAGEGRLAAAFPA
jgi:spermidine/putrescine transport system substrate-binding protein